MVKDIKRRWHAAHTRKCKYSHGTLLINSALCTLLDVLYSIVQKKRNFKIYLQLLYFFSNFALSHAKEASGMYIVGQ